MSVLNALNPNKFNQSVNSPLDDVQNLIDLKKLRLDDTGTPVPEKQNDVGAWLKLLDIIDRPGASVRGGLHGFLSGGSFLEGAKEGFTGKDKIWGSDILSGFGVENKYGKGVGGFALDVLLDPLTFAGGFLGKSAAKGFTAASMPKAAAFAEKGIVGSLAPKFKEFGKGVRSQGITAHGQLPMSASDLGEGVMAELGRSLGSVKLGEQTTLGQASVNLYDTIGKKMGGNKYIGHNISTSSVGEAATYGQAREVLKANAITTSKIPAAQTDMLQTLTAEFGDNPTTRRLLPRLAKAEDIIKNNPNATKKELEKMIFDVGGISNSEIGSIIEQPILEMRKLRLKAEKGKLDMDPAIFTAGEEAFNSPRLREAIVDRIDKTVKRKKDFTLTEKLTKQRYIALKDELNLTVQPKKKDTVMSLLSRQLDQDNSIQRVWEISYDKARHKYLKKYKHTPEIIEDIEGFIKFRGERNLAMAVSEGLVESNRHLPYYIYHMYNSPASEVNLAYLKNPELSRAMSTSIKPHKQRQFETLKDMHKFADNVERKNIKLLSQRLKKEGVPEQRVNTLAQEAGDLRKNGKVDSSLLIEEARKNQVYIKDLNLSPAPRPVEDIFVLEMSRTLEHTRFMTRTKITHDLKKSKLMAEIIPENKDLIPKGWISTDNIPGLDPGFAIHPEMARSLYNLDKILTDGAEFGNILKNYMKLQNLWKGTVTSLAPGWYQNTLFGNVFNGYLGGLYNPAYYGYAAIAQKGGNIDATLVRLKIRSVADQMVSATDGAIQKQGRELIEQLGLKQGANKGFMTTTELKYWLRAEGIEGFGQQFFDIRRTPEEYMRKALGQREKFGLHSTRAAGEFIETNGKLAMFLNELGKRNAALTDVADFSQLSRIVQDSALHTKKYMFDYSDLSKFEQKLKIIFPFYTWTRKNLPLQLESIITQPHKFLAVERLQKASFDMIDMSDEDLENMPSWLRQRAFGIRSKDEGGEYGIFSPLAPSSTLAQAMENPLHMALGMVSPIPKGFFEWGSNVSAFTGQRIERYEGQTVNMFGVEVPAKTAYLLSSIGTFRDASRITEGFLDQKTDDTGTADKKKRVSGHIESDNAALDTIGRLFQQSFREYNPETADLFAHYDYNRKLNDLITLLKERGIDVRTATEIKKELSQPDPLAQLISRKK